MAADRVRSCASRLSEASRSRCGFRPDIFSGARPADRVMSGPSDCLASGGGRPPKSALRLQAPKARRWTRSTPCGLGPSQNTLRRSTGRELHWQGESTTRSAAPLAGRIYYKKWSATGRAWRSTGRAPLALHWRSTGRAPAERQWSAQSAVGARTPRAPARCTPCGASRSEPVRRPAPARPLRAVRASARIPAARAGRGSRGPGMRIAERAGSTAAAPRPAEATPRAAPGRCGPTAMRAFPPPAICRRIFPTGAAVRAVDAVCCDMDKLWFIWINHSLSRYTTVYLDQPQFI